MSKRLSPNINVRTAVKRLMKITISDMRAMSTTELEYVASSIPVILPAIGSELARRKEVPHG